MGRKTVRIFSNDYNKTEDNLSLLISKIKDSDFYIVDRKEDADFTIALGGDGTLLRTLEETNFSSDTVYVGINSGSLGYLQDIEVSEMDNMLELIKKNEYVKEELPVLEVTIEDKMGIRKYYGLNEFEIYPYDNKVVSFKLLFENYPLYDNVCGDGISIATPIGSTGHNQSLGGPIMLIKEKIFSIVLKGAIRSTKCSSVLPNGIVYNSVDIELLDKEFNDALLYIDGNKIEKMQGGMIHVGYREVGIRKLSLSNISMTERLREKKVGM